MNKHFMFDMQQIPATKKVLSHSSFPVSVFYDFRYSIEPAVNIEPEASKPPNRFSLSQWETLLGKNQLDTYKHLFPEQDDEKEDDLDMEGDLETRNDEIMDTESVKLPERHFGQNTLKVFFDYCTLGQCQFVFRSNIIASEVLRGKKEHLPDFLLLLLQNGDLLVINITATYDKNFETYLFKYFATICARSSIARGNWMLSDHHTYRFSYSANSDLIFLTCSNRLQFIFKVHINEEDFMSVRLTRLNNLKTGIIVNQCMLTLNENTDAFLFAELKNNILYLKCMTDFTQFTESKITMKKAFEIPLHMVPLPDTNCVLFLQETGYTIKSFSFCIGGDDYASITKKYPLQNKNFMIDTFYIPKRKILTEDSENYLETGLQFSQVLVSTSHNASIYLINIYYDRTRHKYISNMTRLFKANTIASFFRLEMQHSEGSPTGIYEFEFSNEMGLSESKLGKITYEKGKPLFETIQTLYSLPNNYPMYDFEVVPARNRFSIEDKPNQFWALTGSGSAHSLTRLVQGYDTKIHELLEIYGVTKIYNAGNEYFWLSGPMRSYLVRYVRGDDKVDLILSIDEQIQNTFILDSYSYAISTGHFYVLENGTIVSQHRLPGECQLGILSEDTVILSVRSLDDKFSLCACFIAVTKSGDEVLVKFTDINTPWRSSSMSLVTCLSFFKDSYVVIGENDGTIQVYDIRNNNIQPLGDRIELSKIIKNCHGNFILYQLVERDNLVYFSSTSGEYAVGELVIVNAEVTLEIKQYNKLSDTTPIDICISSPFENYTLLIGKYLWKYDQHINGTPERVYIGEDESEPVTYALPYYDYCLILQDNRLLTSIIAHEPTTIIKSKKFGIPCMKMLNYPVLNLLVLIKVPGIHDNIQPLIFIDQKKAKALKSSFEFEWKDQEFPTCLAELRTYPEQHKFHVSLLVGSCVGKNSCGHLRLLRVSRHESSKVNVKVLSSSKEQTPISDISTLVHPYESKTYVVCSSKNVLFYYELDDYKFTNKSVLYTATENIKKFELTILGESKGDYGLSIIVILQNNTSVSLRCSSFEEMQIEKHRNQFTSNALTLGRNIDVYADYNKEIVTLESQFTNPTFIDIGYVPRLAFTEDYSPWISLREKQKEDRKSFVTVGLNGQADLITTGTLTSKFVGSNVIPCEKITSWDYNRE